MHLAEETDLLRNIPMFALLDASKLKLLAFTSERIVYEDGETLFYVGDSADCAYVIMEGAVDIITETEKGPLQTFTLRENKLIGEMALLNNAPRYATLVANGQLTLLKITEKMFRLLLRENPDFAMDVMRQLTDKLALAHREVESLMTELNRKNIPHSE